jgi:hypothetical protein
MLQSLHQKANKMLEKLWSLWGGGSSSPESLNFTAPQRHHEFFQKNDVEKTM